MNLDNYLTCGFDLCMLSQAILYIQLTVVQSTLLSIVQSLESVSWMLKMYWFYGKVNRAHMVHLLYRGCPYLGGSIIRGFTVFA